LKRFTLQAKRNLKAFICVLKEAVGSRLHARRQQWKYGITEYIDLLYNTAGLRMVEIFFSARPSGSICHQPCICHFILATSSSQSALCHYVHGEGATRK